VANGEPLLLSGITVRGVTHGRAGDSSAKDTPLDSRLSSFIQDVQTLQVVERQGREIQTILVYTTAALYHQELFTAFCKYACTLSRIQKRALRIQIAIVDSEAKEITIASVHTIAGEPGLEHESTLERLTASSSSELVRAFKLASTEGKTLCICHDPSEAAAQRLIEDLRDVTWSLPCRQNLWFCPSSFLPSDGTGDRILTVFVPVQFYGYRIVANSPLERHEDRLPVEEVAALVFFNRGIRRSACEETRCFDCALGLAVLKAITKSLNQGQSRGKESYSGLAKALRKVERKVDFERTFLQGVTQSY